jgi:hypothetical protein
MNSKKNGKIFTSKFVGTGPSSYEKIIYRAAVSQRLRNTALEDDSIFLGEYPGDCDQLGRHYEMRVICFRAKGRMREPVYCVSNLNHFCNIDVGESSVNIISHNQGS